MTSTQRIDYTLPAELIAQTPAARRDGSRLLVVDRTTRSVSHRMFSDLASYLRPGDTLFRNTAAVLPARLHGKRSTGGKVECFLLRRSESAHPGAELWQCLVRPGRRLPPGSSFEIEGGGLAATVVSIGDNGSAQVRFVVRDGGSVVEAANRAGDVPLPPYIERRDNSLREQDRERYQTVYADRARQVAVAAPTAGLHFTPELLDALKARGAGFAFVTLHVGAGTFLPVKTDDLSQHRMHAEYGEVSATAAEAVNATRAAGGRVICVGTTSLRLIESAADPDGQVRPFAAETDIFITPGYRFRAADGLMTNFHLPKSTLFMLVCAFAGRDVMRAAYAHAIADGYRFYSYGDGSLLWRAD